VTELDYFLQHSPEPEAQTYYPTR